jgi:hypothetical protein
MPLEPPVSSSERTVRDPSALVEAGNLETFLTLKLGSRRGNLPHGGSFRR